jgi:hypothetical protein
MKTYLATLAGLLFLAGTATAQAPNPYARPTVTPWLNLYRGGASPALNYYNLVRPELDARAAIQQLQQQSLANTRAIAEAAEAATEIPPTGHQAGFMTQNRYFQTLGGGAPAFGTGVGIGTQKQTSGLNKPTLGTDKPTLR